MHHIAVRKSLEEVLIVQIDLVSFWCHKSDYIHTWAISALDRFEHNIEHNVLVIMEIRWKCGFQRLKIWNLYRINIFEIHNLDHKMFPLFLHRYRYWFISHFGYTSWTARRCDMMFYLVYKCHLKNSKKIFKYLWELLWQTNFVIIDKQFISH